MTNLSKLKDAFEIVIDLARFASLDKREAEFDAEILIPEREKQLEAICTVEDFFCTIEDFFNNVIPGG